MTVGRRIYALICLSFIGLLGVAFLGSRELASSLDQQKQIELQHLGELALGIVKEEHAAAQKGGVSDADAQKRAMARSGRSATAATTISGSTTCIRRW
jgi:methyl-accepting chemotaxis protein